MNLTQQKFKKVINSFVYLKKYLWELSKLKQFLILLFLFIAIPYCLNIILFYTRYALPKDGFIPDEKVIFTFREGDKIYKGHFDNNGDIQKEFLESVNTDQIDDRGLFNTKASSTMFSVNVIPVKYYDLFGLCNKYDFIFKYPCYGFFENVVNISNINKIDEILHGGGIYVFDFEKNKVSHMSLGPISANSNFLSIFIENNKTPWNSDKIDYIFIYNINDHKWKKILQATSHYPVWTTDIELLKIED